MPSIESELFGGAVWDQKRLHEYFLHLAQERERYMGELKGKLKHSPAYEAIFDQTLAEFYVYNHFHGRTFLSSREEFLRALGELEVLPVPNDGYFDRVRFAEHWLRIIRGIQSVAGDGNAPRVGEGRPA